MSTRMSSRYARSVTALSATVIAFGVLAGCGDTDGSATDEPAPLSTAPEPASERQPPKQPPITPPASVEIPDDFPLADGLPRTNGDDGTPVRVTDTGGLADVELCGVVAWSPSEPGPTADVAGTSYTGEAEDSRARTLALYADDEAAAAALTHVREAIAGCPAGEVGGTDQVYEEVEGDQDSATITHRYRTEGRFDTGLEVLQLARSGNALYLASYYGEGGGSPETIASFITFADESSAGVLDALRTFEA